MSALTIKLLRDVARMRGQLVSITLVVGCGIMTYLGSVATYRSLQASRDAYYDGNRFADVFVTLVRAPVSVLAKVRALDGVRQVQGEITWPARASLPAFNEPIDARLQSVAVDSADALDRLTVREGRAPTPGRVDEAVVNELFAEAHALHPGDTMTITVEGRRTRLRIVGVGLSPQYLFIQPEGTFFADNKRFAVVWMEERALASLVRMQGQVTTAAIALAPGASADGVAALVEKVLEHAGAHAVTRARHPSDSRVTQELQQLKGNATLMPLVFLGVAAYLLNILMSRIVELQREQLAALKALGYRGRSVAAHYIAMAALVVAPGLALGLAGGALSGRWFLALYADYFRFPLMELRIPPDVVVVAFSVAMAAALAGALIAVRRAVRLAPAEAMRPASPALYRAGLVEKAHLTRVFGPADRMALRDVLRQPLRLVASTIAVALAAAIVVMGNASFDTVRHMLDVQFRIAEREDLSVSFRRPIDRSALWSLARLPGVRLVEGERLLPVRVHAGHVQRDVVLVGSDAGADLRRIVDAQGRVVTVPPVGVMASRALADRLRVSPGDRVTIELLDGTMRTVTLPVTALVDDLMGLMLHMSRGPLAAAVGEPALVSTALLRVDGAARDAVRRELLEMPQVAGVSSPTVERDLLRKEMDSAFLAYVLILALFAGVLAVGVVYNNARVALSVRARDLATLRVLGFRRDEVFGILAREQALQLVLGIPLGAWLGVRIAALIFATADPEMIRMPIFVTPPTFVMAAAVVVLSALVSGVLVRRRVDRIDLVGVLKARD